MTDFHAGRHAGLLLPLVSMPSTSSWGIGEIPDLVHVARWLDECGFDFLQLLPVNEMAEGQSSPYSAISALAIDPITIALSGVPDFAALGGEAWLDGAGRMQLAAVRAAPRIDYPAVRALKMRALAAAFDRFVRNEWHSRTARAQALAGYIDAERWWLDDYALYRAVRAAEGDRTWREWPSPLAGRDQAVLDEVRGELADAVLFYQYLQWVAQEQWSAARRAAGRVGLFGDFPFVVAIDSADVWTRQGDFQFDASVGTPPDAFAEEGQDWGLPPYRWDVIQRNDYAWLRMRARRMAALYDGYRVDHLVGFYRTFVRPLDGRRPSFTPRDEGRQVELGERLLGIFASEGPRIIAEDLGTVPDFVRASLARLGMPGFKVLRWERDWEVPGEPFRDPRDYPAASVATSGTHDTEPLAVWWDEAPREEREQFAALPAIASLGGDVASLEFTSALRDHVIELLIRSGSDFVILPIQDVFGWRDRINEPATVSDDNWTWRLPWPSDELSGQVEARERARVLRAWCAAAGRTGESSTTAERKE